MSKKITIVLKIADSDWKPFINSPVSSMGTEIPMSILISFLKAIYQFKTPAAKKASHREYQKKFF